jgi:hypothetical protein
VTLRRPFKGRPIWASARRKGSLLTGSGGGTEHLDHSVKNSDELARLTGLPVLGSIMRIQTGEDITQARRKRKLIWAVTGFALILGLVLFHFFYMDLWVLTARLLRLMNKYT